MSNAFFQTNFIKKIIITAIIVATLSMSLALRAHAQEINPAPGTYAYGSSSEFSPFSILTPGSNSGTLASTGQNQSLGFYIIGASLVLLAVTTVVIIRGRRKKA